MNFLKAWDFLLYEGSFQLSFQWIMWDVVYISASLQLYFLENSLFHRLNFTIFTASNTHSPDLDTSPASLQLYLNFALPFDDADFSPSQSTIQNHILHPYGYLFASVNSRDGDFHKNWMLGKSKGIRKLPVSLLPLFDKMNNQKSCLKIPVNLLIYFLRNRTRDI